MDVTMILSSQGHKDPMSTTSQTEIGVDLKILNSDDGTDVNNNHKSGSTLLQPTAKSKVVPFFGTTDSRYRGTTGRLTELKKALAKLGDWCTRQSNARRTELSYKISNLEK